MPTPPDPRPHWLSSIRDWQVAAAIAFSLALIMASECRSISTPANLCYGAAFSTWWCMVGLALWRLGQWMSSALRFTPRNILLHLAAATILGLTHLLLIGLLHTLVPRWFYPAPRPPWSFYLDLNRFGIELLVYACAFGLFGLLHAQAQRQQDALQKLTLERQLSQSQLQALQMQIEPHFLFNTMNALASLVAQGRNREASKTLTHLNTILRTTLQRRAPEKVPFTEELRVIESYLAIQQVRFTDRLQVQIDTTPEALEGLVPSFILQPIIENAIQHGISQMDTGGLIQTSAKRVGDTLWMQVRDNGCGSSSPTTKGHGIAIQNIRERLAHFYPNAHQFAAAPMAEGGYEVTIQIPYERSNL